MASTAAERKRKEREEKKEQGMVQKSIWLRPETLKIIENYKEKYSDKDHKVSDEDAINELINKNAHYLH